MDVKLDKQSKIPVYLQIVDQLRAQIMCGALPSGSVLPSERGLAQMLEVHRNTVVKAYGELKSDAWIESRQGIGYVVAVPPAAEDGGEGEAGASDKPSRRVNWINEIKDRHLDMEKTFDDLFQRFTDESKYSLGSGISTNEVFRPERVAHDIAPLMTSAGCCQYFYSPYKGDKFLRQKLVSFLSTKGVKASTGEIQISVRDESGGGLHRDAPRPARRHRGHGGAGPPGYVPRDGAGRREDPHRAGGSGRDARGPA